MAANGIVGLVDQLHVWLQKAAAGTLSEGKTWEPIRRDQCQDVLACDPAAIRTVIRAKAGYAFLACRFRRRDAGAALVDQYRGRAGRKVGLDFGAKSVLLSEKHEPIEHGLALVIWSDRDVNGAKVVEGEFRPDDVTDIASFEAQAKRFRMMAPLNAGRAALVKAATDQVQGATPLPVIMLVRRPRPMADDNSPIELVTYLTQVSLPDGQPATDEVRPLACAEDIRRNLLRRLSGLSKPEPWALLGAGSLGSKIALSRARGGAAPLMCADPSTLRPHNAARHALYPSPDEPLHGAWLDKKSPALAEAIRGLEQDVRVIAGDHRALVHALSEEAAPTVSWLVNTTGSTIAREWLSSPEAVTAPRAAEAGLFDRGDFGFVAIEGRYRNPDLAEIMGEFYSQAHQREDLRQRLFPGGDPLDFVPMGQGCGAATMVMSDAHLSAMAAPMTEILAQPNSRLDAGRLHLLSRHGYGMEHEELRVRARVRVPLEGLADWTVSLSPDLLAAIDADTGLWPGVETGGILVGWSSLIARRIFVAALLPAPSDSRRSAHEFLLGVEGVRPQLEQLSESTRGVLRCVGTWHSHLGGAAPSERDWASAASLGASETVPMTLVVRGVDGVRAISTTAASLGVSRMDKRDDGG